ncbi:MAG: neutral/alkaline non-lysosomal ceramidase N-terminal domain-containing protein [Armatimonadota bacterium]
MMGELRVGISRRNITPPVGASMAGYAARDHGAEGVRDELWLRALFLDDGDAQAVLMCRDVCDTQRGEMDLLEGMFEQRMGLKPEQLFIANTHTHSGPSTSYEQESDNRDYVENLAAVCVGAAEEARANARPVVMTRAQRPVQCGVNRRERTAEGQIVLGVNPEGPCDTTVDVLVFAEPETAEPVATLFRHGVHGVVMGSDNYLISGDAPGAAERFVEANLPGAAGFLAGASGNINAHPRGSFENVDMLGRRLGGAVVQATTEAEQPRTDVRIVSLRHELELPVEEPAPEDELREEIEELEAAMERLDAGEDVQGLTRWRTDRRLRHARSQLEMLEAGEEIGGKPTFVQVLAIGDVALVGYPAEVFYEIGREVRERSPFALTLDVTHVNGWSGYIPIASAFDEGGYEIQARVHHCGLGITPEAEAVLITESLRGLARARRAIGD